MKQLISKNCLDVAPIKIYCLFDSVPYSRLRKQVSFICAVLFTEYNSGDQIKLERMGENVARVGKINNAFSSL